MKLRHAWAAAIAAACTVAAPLSAQTKGIVIDGDVPRPYVMTAETFAKLQPVGVPALGDEIVHQYRAVSLHCFLEEAGIQFGDALRVPQMASYVIVEGRDGMQVVLSLASLDEPFGGGVYLADAVDERPLGGDYRLIIPGDARPTRWVRQVVRITVKAAP